MTFTQAELNTIVFNALCCYSDKVDTVIDLKNIGDVSYVYMNMELKVLWTTIGSLKDYDITSGCLTDADITYFVDNINAICGNCC